MPASAPDKPVPPGSAAGPDSTATASPSIRFKAGLISVGVWAGGNLALWLTLFGLPWLAGVPVIWRLFVGIFANFYLIPFARELGKKHTSQVQATTPQGGNPFSS